MRTRAALKGCATTTVFVSALATLLAQDGQWLMYSGSFSSHRFSPLAQLTPSNVGRRKPAWV